MRVYVHVDCRLRVRVNVERAHTHTHTHTLRLRVQSFRIKFTFKGGRSKLRVLSPGLQCLRQICDERDQRACKCATA